MAPQSVYVVPPSLIFCTSIIRFAYDLNSVSTCLLKRNGAHLLVLVIKPVLSFVLSQNATIIQSPQVFVIMFTAYCTVHYWTNSCAMCVQVKFPAPPLEFLQPADNETRVRLEPDRRTAGTPVFDVRMGSTGTRLLSTPPTQTGLHSQSDSSFASESQSEALVHYSLRAQHTNGPNAEKTVSTPLPLEIHKNYSGEEAIGQRPDGPFTIDNQTGRISLRFPLTEEDAGDWFLIVRANDSAGNRIHTATLVVEVSCSLPLL